MDQKNADIEQSSILPPPLALPCIRCDQKDENFYLSGIVNYQLFGCQTVNAVHGF